ncbi:MAG: MarR family transcriptional regulator [Rhizobium sp.]|nr:MarR family transcriptional regulator [Rhizobium sp.]
MVRSVQAREADVLGLDKQICFPLYAATNLLGRAYRSLLEPLGLTYSQYLVMLVLWNDGPVHVRDLTRRLHLDSGTITPLLKRMERNGLLTRTRDADDERCVVVRLTPYGKAMRKRAAEVPTALAHRIGDRFGSDAAESLRVEASRFVRILAGQLDGRASSRSD